MDSYIAVKVIPYDFPKLLDVNEDASGTLSFTTVKQGQHEALIELFIVENGIRRELSTEVISHIPDIEPGHIRIQVRGRVVNRMLEYQVYFQKRLYKRASISLKEYIPSRLPMYAGFAVGGILLLAGAIWGISSLGNSTFSQVANPGSTTKPAAQTNSNETEATVDNYEVDLLPDITIIESENVDEIDTVAEALNDVEESTIETDVSAATVEEPEVEIVLPELSKNMVVRFAPESPVLTQAAKAKLETLVNETMDIKSIEIIGHCALYRDEPFRKALSQSRADNTAAYLKTKLDSTNIDFKTVGRGGSEPLTRDPNSQDVNRRVEINITYTEKQ